MCKVCNGIKRQSELRKQLRKVSCDCRNPVYAWIATDTSDEWFVRELFTLARSISSNHFEAENWCVVCTNCGKELPSDVAYICHENHGMH